MRPLLVSLLLLLAAPFSAQADEYVPVTPDPEVDALLKALEKGSRDEAIAKVKGIFALVDEQRLVTTPSAFVDLVLGCTPQQVNANTGFKLYTYRWDCSQGSFQASLAKDPSSSYVEVVDPADERRLAERAKRPQRIYPRTPSLPSIESPEVRKTRQEQRGHAELVALRALKPQLKAGRLTDPTALASRSNFTTGYRDYAQNTFISKMDGDGLVAANEQLAWLTESLGKPASVECEQKKTEHSEIGFISFLSYCTVKAQRPGHGYTAMVTFRDAKIASIQFNYMNREVFEKNRDFLTSLAGED